jgi:hypothetical protein
MLGLEQCTYLNMLTLTNYVKGFKTHGLNFLNLKQSNVVLYIIDHKDDYQLYSKIDHSTLAFA